MPGKINDYDLLSEFTTAGAGTCQWAFARKNGQEYFIKEFLSPKYPLDPSVLGPEITEKMRRRAEEFYYRKRSFYQTLEGCNTGNNMIIRDFFRCGSKYYAVSDRVTGPLLTVDQVARMPEDKKRVLIRALLFSLDALHSAGIVHSDLKPDNILIKTTQNGFCTAKIIDFEAGFFEKDPPEYAEGTQGYFSPEMHRKVSGETVPVTTAADIFSLGLVIHQYWCGQLPTVDKRFATVTDAVMAGGSVRLSPGLPHDIREAVAGMLQPDPGRRPTARQLLSRLGADPAPPPKRAPAYRPVSFRPLTDDDL